MKTLRLVILVRVPHFCAYLHLSRRPLIASTSLTLRLLRSLSSRLTVAALGDDAFDGVDEGVQAFVGLCQGFFRPRLSFGKSRQRLGGARLCLGSMGLRVGGARLCVVGARL